MFTTNVLRGLVDNCTVLFYGLFYYLEDNYLLDIENEVHMFCLHYIYLQRLNASLQLFKEAWNNHPLSTERNHTPIQLWISGHARIQMDEQISEVSNYYSAADPENGELGGYTVCRTVTHSLW